MKKNVLGILAHVDSGKTTLSEAMLFEAGNIKKLGRVDNQNATLDTHALERKRGITIFAKQAMINFDDIEISLLDTPGHTDFSGEMERTLGVLDYAILVINGSDGVQSHTETLWNLLKHHNIPTFIFVNKMDLITADKSKVLGQIHKELSVNVVNFTDDNLHEKIAECDENILDNYLNTGNVTVEEIYEAILNRKVFPCFFGSALKDDGVLNLLKAIKNYTKMPEYPSKFSGKVFKISRDSQRLTYIKVTGGSLKVKDVIAETGEKVQQIRIYSGENFTVVDEAKAGSVCAVTGLLKSYVGQGLGLNDQEKPILQPILTYKVEFLEEYDPFLVYEKLKILGEEDPLLSIIWNEFSKTISIGIMGEIQIEVLKVIVLERFGYNIDFGQSNIVYKETICEKSEGVGHFEPLRHYAEVRLLLEPLKQGEGIIIATKCKEENLSRSYQALIMSHLAEISHRGVLTGSYITDMKITLVGGKSHAKHTEGGDFRQASYRALQQGLRGVKCQLLEPFYKFKLIVPLENVGKAIHDLEGLSANVEPFETVQDTAILVGTAPVKLMRDYAKDIASYTKGLGKISCTFFGYLPCHNTDQVIKEINYDYTLYENTNPDSVFCTHGSGFNVKWNKVEEYAHTEKYIKKPSIIPVIKQNIPKVLSSFENDKELMKIFEKTYGPIKVDKIRAFSKQESSEKVYKKSDFSKPEYLLVDGYNIIFAWPELQKLAEQDVEYARSELINLMCNYQGFKGCQVVVVFDAYKVKGNHGEVERHHNIHVVYTKEAETADMYIEKVTYEMAKNFKVRVATSDALEQMIIWGHGAFRVSADTFSLEVLEIDKAIRDFCI